MRTIRPSTASNCLNLFYIARGVNGSVELESVVQFITLCLQIPFYVGLLNDFNPLVSEG